MNTKKERITINYFPKKNGLLLYNRLLEKINNKNSIIQNWRKITQNGVTYYISQKLHSTDGRGNLLRKESNITFMNFYKESNGYYQFQVKRNKENSFDLKSIIASIHFLD